MKYTSSHWGTYRITETGLEPVEQDPAPAPAGRGWYSAATDPKTRVARPSFRAGWLNGRDRNRHGGAEFVELPWDETLDIVSEELNRVIDNYGNTLRSMAVLMVGPVRVAFITRSPNSSIS